MILSPLEPDVKYTCTSTIHVPLESRLRKNASHKICEIESACMNGCVKALIVYYGNLVTTPNCDISSLAVGIV